MKRCLGIGNGWPSRRGLLQLRPRIRLVLQTLAAVRVSSGERAPHAVVADPEAMRLSGSIQPTGDRFNAWAEVHAPKMLAQVHSP